MSDRLEETKPDIKLIRALQADFKALYQPKYTANHKTKQMLINIELGIMQLKNLQSYIDSKIIEARGGLETPSDTASVGGNQVADPILVSELFRMVYQWGRVGVVVDSSAPAFQEQLKEVIGSLK